MVYTVALNPALERTLCVERIQANDANRIESEERYAGGKGIDVSKVLTALGTNNRVLGLIGGFAGEELEGWLLNEVIGCNFARISGETCTNIIVNDMSTGKQIVLSDKGPEIRTCELMQMIHKIERLEHPDTALLSGSLPPGVHPEI
jgi:6-phosphofructokinase 2